MPHFPEPKDGWSWADIVRGHKIYPSSRKIQVILLVCHWIYDHNNDCISKILDQKQRVDEYLFLLNKYEDYDNDFDAKMMDSYHSRLSKGDIIQQKIFNMAAYLLDQPLWIHYKGVFKKKKCRVCKKVYRFTYGEQYSQDIIFSFRCECFYYQESLHKHVIYNAQWMFSE